MLVKEICQGSAGEQKYARERLSAGRKKDTRGWEGVYDGKKKCQGSAGKQKYASGRLSAGRKNGNKYYESWSTGNKNMPRL